MLSREQKQLKKRYIKQLNAVENVDKDMIQESILNYNIEEIDYQDKICLDLGTNIGAFTKIALDRGAKRVYGVECDLRNYQIASANFSSEIRAKIIHAAVSSVEQDKLQIYKSNAKSNHSSTSIIKRSGTFTEYDEVKNYHINYLLEEVKPQIVKIDIEGAEYSIIEQVLNYRPDVLFIELHGNDDRSKSVVQRLQELYPNGKVSDIIIFQRVGGYDCLFYK
jgi:FkbM family methyltransferase